MTNPILLRMACAYWTASRERLKQQNGGATALLEWADLSPAVQDNISSDMALAAEELLDTIARLAAPGQPEHLLLQVRQMVRE